jgi:DNA replication and repair protein RecF
VAIDSLDIVNFRNLQHVSLHCSPRLNLIFGENASGKTSLLEAIYFLGRARSFRTRQGAELIHHGQTALRVVAKVAIGGRLVPLGIERSVQQLSARIDSQPVRSLAELAVHLPVLLLNPDSHRLLEDGPQQRRRFIDWGLFHRESAFLPAWKRFQSALKNRNAALRAGEADRSLAVWEHELTAAAAVLDSLRDTFCKALQAQLAPFLQATLGRVAPTIDYRRGWSQEQDLAELLRRDREQDRQQGYTRHGPHRADFIIRLDSRPIAERLSRGQQKLLVIALVLAQAQLYQEHTGQACILLIDDLPAELDRPHRERVMACLAEQTSQSFITAIEAGLLNSHAWEAVERQVFKLTQGVIKKTEEMI